VRPIVFRSWAALLRLTPFTLVMISPVVRPARIAGEPGSTLPITAPSPRRDPKCFSQFRGQILNRNPNPSTTDLTALDDLLEDEPRHVDWHREPNPHITAGARQDCRVDADELAVEVTRAPPEFPGLIEASVWMKSS
jgi:hypothetical protein